MGRGVARIGNENGAKLVAMPLEFQRPDSVKEVFVRKVGDEVILSPRPSDCRAFLISDVRASDDFMIGIRDLPVQERDLVCVRSTRRTPTPAV